MAFRKTPKTPPVPLTNAQQAERHRRLAEHYLAKSKKAGRIEYHVQLAATANAHATLAIFYQNADPSVVIVQSDDGDDDVEDVEQLEEPDAGLGVDLVGVASQVPAAGPCCSKAGPDGRHFGPCTTA